MKKVKYIGMIVTILIMVTSLSAGAAAWPNPGQGSTDVVVMNTSAAPISLITADYIGPTGSGTPDETKTCENLPLNGTCEFLASGTNLTPGWSGAMIVSATDTIAALGTVKWGGQAAGGDVGDDGDMGQYTGVGAGSSPVYCPALYQVDTGPLYSTMTIQNTGSADAQISIEFRDRNGVAYAGNPVTKTAKPGAQTTLNLSTEPAYFASKDGSAVITSNQPIAAVVAIHWPGRSSTYLCPTKGDKKLYVPAQYRLTNGGSDYNSYLLFSANVLMNLTGQTAHTTFHYIPRDVTKASLDVPIEIPPFSAKGANTFNGGSVPAATFEPLGLNWDGVVVIDSDQDLAGINNTNWGPAGANKSATFTIVGPSSGSNLVYLPYQRRVTPAGDWQEWSAAIVQNLSADTANVTLTYYNAAGVQQLQLTQAIGGNLAFGFNTRTGGSRPASDFLPLGENYQGGLKITSNVAIAVVAQVITASAAHDMAGAYNGIPMP